MGALPGGVVYLRSAYIPYLYCLTEKLQIQIYTYKPSGAYAQLDSEGADSFPCSMEVTYTDGNIDQRGYWTFEGRDSYWWGSSGYFQYEGDSWVDVWIDLEPTWESSSFNYDVPGGENVVVAPGPYKYYGGEVEFSVFGISDGCHSSLPTGPEFVMTPSPANVDYNSRYTQDVVYDGGSDWVDYYNTAIAANVIGSCSWSGSQNMTFEYDPYYGPISIAQSLNGTSVTTYRDNASHIASWN